MITNIGLSTFILVLAVLTTCWIFIYLIVRESENQRVANGQIFSFKESLDLAGLPIITFRQGNNKFNFLLDTGSNVSYINGTSLIETIPIDSKDSFIGAEGVSKECQLCYIKLCYKDAEYQQTFRVADLTAAFSQVKTATGVTLNGIIGNDFMEKYKYCIDFKEYLVYQRK